MLPFTGYRRLLILSLKFLRCLTQNHLMECLLADVTLVCLLTRMRESVVLIISFLVEAFSAELADVRSISLVNPHVSIEGGASVKGLSASRTLVRFFRSVNNLMSAQSRGLTKPFSANLTYKRSCT